MELTAGMALGAALAFIVRAAWRHASRGRWHGCPQCGLWCSCCVGTGRRVAVDEVGTDVC